MSLKSRIEGALKARVRLRAGAPGALDVLVDGEKIYSKKETGRMPNGDELIELIRPKLVGA